MTNFDKIIEELSIEKLSEIITSPSHVCILFHEPEVCLRCPLYNNCTDPSVVKAWLEQEFIESDKVNKTLKDFINWFTDQYASGIDEKNKVLLVGRGGKYVDALKVYMEEHNDEH